MKTPNRFTETPKSLSAKRKLQAASKLPILTPAMEKRYEIERNFEQVTDQFNKKNTFQQVSVKQKNTRRSLIANSISKAFQKSLSDA